MGPLMIISTLYTTSDDCGTCTHPLRHKIANIKFLWRHSPGYTMGLYQNLLEAFFVAFMRLVEIEFLYRFLFVFPQLY